MEIHVKRRINILDFCTAGIIASSLALRNFPYLLYAFQLLLIVVGGMTLIKRINIKYTICMVLFLEWSLLSLLWATEQSRVISNLVPLVQVGVICIFLSGYLTSVERIDKVIDYFLLASIILVVNLLLFTSPAEWRNILFYSQGENVNASSSAGRIGSTISLHPNEMAITVAICILCAVFRVIQTKKKRYVVLGVILAALLMLTKSRSSIFVVAVGVCLLYVFFSRNPVAFMKRIALGVLIVIIVLWACVSIPFLYDLVGYRMEGLLALFTSSDVDASTSGRLDMIIAGLKIFSNRPVTGVGLANYGIIAFTQHGIWTEVYAHNNYIELLSCLGLVGFTIYYGIRFLSIYSMWIIEKNADRANDQKKRQLYIFLKTLLVTLLIAEFAQVTYYNECCQYVYVMLIAAAFLRQGKTGIKDTE